MKICMINGSIKEKRSTSEYLLEQIENKLSSSADVLKLNWEDFAIMPPQNCDALVLAFPLFMDSIPSNLLSSLEKTEEIISEVNPSAKVYIIVNNAFYEPDNDLYAVRIIQSWCNHAGLQFGGALCLGAGPVASISSPGSNQMKNLDEGLENLADAINNQCSLTENIYIEPNMPKSDYMNNANQNWIKAAAKRGLTKSDLSKKL